MLNRRAAVPILPILYIPVQRCLEHAMDEHETVLEATAECHGCGVCVAVCPRGAIRMVVPDVPDAPDPPDAPERLGPPARAEIDQARCDLCRKCLDVCPVEAILEPYPPSWR